MVPDQERSSPGDAKTARGERFRAAPSTRLAVSTTAGGNLTIDSAPTAAVKGETATIEVSWTGATAGEWHLGAVSHNDATGRFGLTLVEVDNR